MLLSTLPASPTKSDGQFATGLSSSIKMQNRICDDQLQHSNTHLNTVDKEVEGGASLATSTPADGRKIETLIVEPFPFTQDDVFNPAFRPIEDSENKHNRVSSMQHSTIFDANCGAFGTRKQTDMLL